jgi:histidinol-phosphate aminotransferase
MPTRLRDSIQAIPAYSPGKPIEEVQREYGLTEVIKLASNENPLGPSPKAVEAIIRSAAAVNLYPDAAAHDLKLALSERAGLPIEQIVLGNGSDELIHYLSLLLLETGAEAVIGDPSFPRYFASAQLAGAKAIKVGLNDREEHDLDAMLAAVTDQTRLIWIANPNNPTGTIVRRPALERFLDAIPDTAVVALDEAYFEFVDDPEYPNSLDYVREGRQVVGLRTFSKTHGLAGLRVGYCFGPSRLTEALDRIRSAFNVNALAQVAALAALDDDEHLANTISLNRAGVARLSELLRRHGGKVAESFGNFVWADLGDRSQGVCKQMLERGVILRSGTVFGKPNAVRVSVGSVEEMDAFEAAFEEVMKA